MNDGEFITYARLFERVPWERMLSILALVFSVCLAEGILTEGEVRPLVMQIVSQDSASAPLMGVPVDVLFPTPVRSRADEIDMLYLEVHGLAEAASVDPTNETSYQACLSRLRELQGLEAQEMIAFAESRRQLPRGALDAAMAHVRALLATNENSST